MGIRGIAILGGATIAAALVGAAATETVSSAERVQERPRGVVEDCRTRSEASFPGAFTDRDNLVAGPLALYGAGGRVHFDREFGGQKFQALVRNGHRVTVALPEDTPTGAGLAYGPLPRKPGVRDTHRVVKFVACRRDQPSGSDADGRPVTFWSGGVLARSPRCVPLQIWVDNKPPRSAVIHLGVRSCED